MPPPVGVAGAHDGVVVVDRATGAVEYEDVAEVVGGQQAVDSLG